jgi:predicted nucleotidyltransferase
MTTHELIAKLHTHQKELRRMGVASLAVFGSAARGEADITIGNTLNFRPSALY